MSRTERVWRIWRLVDGKAGHERQTQGLIQALAELTSVEITDLDVSCGLLHRLGSVIAISVKKSKTSCPDLLIGAGRKTRLPGLLARFLTGAKLVMLMNPGPVYRTLGDFCIVPVHDKVSESDKVLIVQGVLNMIFPGGEVNQDDLQGLILIGGPSRHVIWEDQAIEAQIRSVVELNPQVTWTVTNSRRTPEVMNDSLRRLASKCSNLRYYSHEKTGPSWLPEQLLRCGQIWVSPDSVAMIYEALTAGGKVGIFDLSWKPDSRLKIGLDDLLSRNMVTAWSQYDHQVGLSQFTDRLAEARRSARWLMTKLSSC